MEKQNTILGLKILINLILVCVNTMQVLYAIHRLSRYTHVPLHTPTEHFSFICLTTIRHFTRISASTALVRYQHKYSRFAHGAGAVARDTSTTG